MWTYIVLLLGICLRDLELCSKDAAAFWPPDFILCFNFSAFVKILFYNLTFSVVISLTQSGMYLLVAWIYISRKAKDAARLLQHFLTVYVWRNVCSESLPSITLYHLSFHFLFYLFFMKILFLKVIFLAVLRLESQVLCILGWHCHWTDIRSPHDVGARGGQRCWGPWGWSYRWLRAAQWVLGTEPGRAVSAASPGPAPQHCRNFKAW